MALIRYIRVNFKFRLLRDFVRYIRDLVLPGLVISGYWSIHFTVNSGRGKRISFVIAGSSLNLAGLCCRHAESLKFFSNPYFI